MELDEQLKNKTAKRFLKRLGSFCLGNDVYTDLISGEYSVNITTRGKFTIAEIKYEKCNYIHHFIGVSAKNPNDVANPEQGIKFALEDALGKLITKFSEDIFDEVLKVEIMIR